MTELDKLKAALRWALDHGASVNSEGDIWGGGCGCCDDRLEVPTEFADVVTEAAGSHD